MVKIEFDNTHAPNICLSLKESLELLEDYKKYILAIQLDYRENNTIFHLNKIKSIKFAKDWMEIIQNNDSKIFLDYQYIIEYCIINAEDELEKGVI